MLSPRHRQVIPTTWELVGLLDSLLATLSNEIEAEGHDWLRAVAAVAAEIEYGLLHRAEAGAGALVQECEELTALLRRAPLPASPDESAASPLERLRARALATCHHLTTLLRSEAT